MGDLENKTTSPRTENIKFSNSTTFPKKTVSAHPSQTATNYVATSIDSSSISSTNRNSEDISSDPTSKRPINMESTTSTHNTKIPGGIPEDFKNTGSFKGLRTLETVGVVALAIFIITIIGLGICALHHVKRDGGQILRKKYGRMNPTYRTPQSFENPLAYENSYEHPNLIERDDEEERVSISSF